MATSNTHLCVRGVENASLCRGDTGGALMAVDALDTNKNWFAIGISSYGGDCGEEYPGVYTRISSYSEWIINNINSNK